MIGIAKKFGSGVAVVFAASACVTAPVSAQDDVLVAAPTTNWVVDFDDNSCALTREFEVGEENFFLELRTFGPVEELQVIVASSSMRRTSRDPRLSFLPDESARLKRGTFTINLADGYSGLLTSHSLKPSALEEAEEGIWEFEKPAWQVEERAAREQEISGLLIDDGFQKDVILQTGGMHAVMDVMRTCVDDLVLSWGFDPVVHRNLEQRPTPSNRDDFVKVVQRLYPREMLSSGRQARLVVRLDLSAEGVPTACHHQSELNDTEFEVVSCDLLLEHARFNPAMDDNGKPTASFYLLSIVYRV